MKTTDGARKLQIELRGVAGKVTLAESIKKRGKLEKENRKRKETIGELTLESGKN